MRERVAAGRIAAEDERSADWIHLLPHAPAVALVVGCGWGAVPSALASRGAHVVAIDHSAVRLAFVAVRAEQERLDVRCVRASANGDLPLRGTFDLVAFLDPDSPRAANPGRMAREAARLLRPGGSIAWRTDNAIGLTRNGRAPRAMSLCAQYAALRQHGFTHLHAYAPLPDRGIPFFHVPLGHDGAMRYFLAAILPLTATAPPETRRRYGIAARLATVAASAAWLPGVSRAAQLVVPGWLVLARAGTPHAR